jgi:hypothetical protein
MDANYGSAVFLTMPSGEKNLYTMLPAISGKIPFVQKLLMTPHVTAGPDRKFGQIGGISTGRDKPRPYRVSRIMVGAEFIPAHSIYTTYFSIKKPGVKSPRVLIA